MRTKDSLQQQAMPILWQFFQKAGVFLPYLPKANWMGNSTWHHYVIYTYADCLTKTLQRSNLF